MTNGNTFFIEVSLLRYWRIYRPFSCEHSSKIKQKMGLYIFPEKQRLP